MISTLKGRKGSGFSPRRLDENTIHSPDLLESSYDAFQATPSLEVLGLQLEPINHRETKTCDSVKTRTASDLSGKKQKVEFNRELPAAGYHESKFSRTRCISATKRVGPFP